MYFPLFVDNLLSVGGEQQISLRTSPEKAKSNAQR